MKSSIRNSQSLYLDIKAVSLFKSKLRKTVAWI